MNQFRPTALIVVRTIQFQDGNTVKLMEKVVTYVEKIHTFKLRVETTDRGIITQTTDTTQAPDIEKTADDKNSTQNGNSRHGTKKKS